MNWSDHCLAVLAAGCLCVAGCSDDPVQRTADDAAVDTAADAAGTDTAADAAGVDTAADAAAVDTAADAAGTDTAAPPSDGSSDGIEPAGDTAADTAAPLVESGLTTQTLAHGGGTRTYLQYIPQGWDGQTPAPVMLNFHGNGGDAEGHLAWTDMRALADAHGFVLIYPQGSPLDGESHWNPLLPSPTNKSDADDIGFVAAMLDALSAAYSIDAGRVYATGYSNGAGLAYGLACYLSDRIAAVAPVSGSMYVEMASSCAASHPTAVAILNGTDDPIRPYEGFPGWLLPVEDAVDWWVDYNGITAPPTIDSFPSNGVTVERRTYTGGTGGAGVTLFKVVGGDHVWFDVDVEGANTSELVWNFVSAYDIDGLR